MSVCLVVKFSCLVVKVELWSYFTNVLSCDVLLSQGEMAKPDGKKGFQL
jgi:hypothetical protein